MKKNKKRGHSSLWAVVYGILLTGYTVFTLLDAFVIPGKVVYISDLDSDSQNAGEKKTGENGQNTGQDAEDGKNWKTGRENSSSHSITGESSQNAGEKEEGENNENIGKDESGTENDSTEQKEQSENLKEPVITETSYENENIRINITAYREYETQIYAADIVISDSSYLRTGLAGDAFGRNVNEVTSAIAERNQAILAINGDFYGFRDKGIVMRNGYLYRDTRKSGEGNEDLIIYEDGKFEIMDEAEIDTDAVAADGAVQIFSFGSGLVQGGEITVDEDSEVEQAMRSNPRTAIGITEPVHYIMLVSDGRTQDSAGLTLMELAAVMKDLGCEEAYNLDGGGSTTMWFLGKIVNVPTSGRRTGERRVSDIVYIGE